MKILVRIEKMILTSMLAALTLVSIAVSAQNTPEKKVKIHISVTEDGITTETTKEIVLDDKADLEQILRELELSDDLNINNDGEKVMIKIQKMENEEVMEDVDIEIFQPYDKKVFFGTPEAANPKPLLGVFIKGTSVENGGEEYIDGARITEVMSNSGAEKAGLQEGDVITGVNDEAVSGHRQLVDLIRSHKVGEVVEIEYYRDGAKNTTTAVLGEGKSYRYQCRVGPENSQYFQEIMERHEKMMEKHGKMMEEREAIQQKPFLGIVNQTYVDEETQFKGVKIDQVVDNSTAKAIGLEEGDVITSINNEKVTNINELRDALWTMEPGDDLEVEFVRDGRSMSKSGKIKSREETGYEDDCCKYIRMRCGDPCYKPCDKTGNSSSESHIKTKEVNVSIEIEEITPKEVEELNKKSGYEIKPENDLRLRSLAISPNPGTGNFSVNARLANMGNVVLRVLDITGREVYTASLENVDAFRRHINISSEPSGVYFLTIIQGDQQFNTKLVKQD